MIVANTGDMLDACLKVSKASVELFDLVEEKGLTAPMDDLEGVMKLKRLCDATEEIRAYYFRRNLQRMLALGVDPADLLRMLGDDRD